MLLPDLLVSVDHPFPGLRPFETSESLLFFGREEHTQELLRRLSGGRFLAVVGTSGSGKSSLVRAGLLPALYRGYLVGSTTHWRIAVMRPGAAPIENLCAALADNDALGGGDQERRLELLQSSSLGLVEVVRAANLDPGESLLIVADQFEELFRYQRQAGAGDSAAEAASEAALFVSLLLQAAERFDSRIYVVLTMRSDFLGDCSQFSGLPEALSRSQYLISRLTREQRRQAIERPLHLAGAGITAPLAEQLLNDSSDDAATSGSVTRGSSPDPLPVLQHALMRTYGHWKAEGAQGDLDLSHYEEVGGIKDALNQHAESIYGKLGVAGQLWAEKIFRCLTSTESGRPVRRPTRLNRLYTIVGAVSTSDHAAVDDVLRSFLERENSLLASSSKAGLQPEAEIDIPHESLIWKWQRLQEWVRKEAVSAEWYLDLVNDTSRFRRGESGLWRGATLARALALRRTEGWNESWAAQYHASGGTSYSDVIQFLDRSRASQVRERWIWGGMTAVAVVALVASFLYWRRVQEAEETNRILLSQVSELKNREEKAKSDAQRYATEVAQKTALLSSSLSPEERSKLEKQIQEAKDRAEHSQKTADQLKDQRDQAAKAAASGADLGEVNKALQNRVKTLEEQLESARNNAESWQAGHDTAVFENGRLKVQLQQAIKERDALKAAAIPTPAAKEPAAAEPGKLLISEVPQAGTVRRNPLDGLDYVWIPPGDFQMGCSPGDKECFDFETPLHQVKISKGFWIGQTEVTQSAYEKLMLRTPSLFKGPQRPVEDVSYVEAIQYCKAAGSRLPTEAEWEYAARAGSTTARYGVLDAIAWHSGNSKKTTHPVKQKLPNAWGLYDTLGNVWEWTADGYDPRYYEQKVLTDPASPASGQYRVLRGGSWNNYPRDVRVSDRNRSWPDFRAAAFGFRCAGELR